MKKLSFRYLLGLVPALAFFHVAIAQEEKSFTETGKKDFSKISIPKFSSDESTPLPAPEINVKAVKKFDRSFKKVTDERWYTFDEGYVAEFEKDGIKTRVFYSKKGAWTAMVRTYHEDKLPSEIRHMVKNIYYDYDIIHVIEVNALNKTAYLVKMEGRNNIKTIRVLDDEMDEYESFQKSK